MHHLRVAKSENFRTLSLNEIKLVAGGLDTDPPPEPEDDPIVVTGTRDPWVTSIDGEDLWMYPELFESTDTGLGDYGDGGGGGETEDSEPTPEEAGNNMTEEQEEATAAWLKATIDTLKEFAKDNPNAKAQLPDGRIVPVSDLLDGLSKTLGALEAGTLALQIAQGDKNVNEAIYFAFGITAYAMASGAGAPAAVAAAIGYTAQQSASSMVDWINWFKFEAVPAAEEYFDSYTMWLAEQIPNTGAETEAEFWDGLFGPTNPYNGEYNIP